jgi:hypothetical protein
MIGQAGSSMTRKIGIPEGILRKPGAPIPRNGP